MELNQEELLALVGEVDAGVASAEDQLSRAHQSLEKLLQALDAQQDPEVRVGRQGFVLDITDEFTNALQSLNTARQRLAKGRQWVRDLPDDLGRVGG
jgi:exonuclease VII small subunit